VAQSVGRAGNLIWSDEFDGPAGSPPSPLRWSHETGGHGWGNDEAQVYTSDAANAFHDGRGNLVIRARRRSGEFTSARLITKGLFEFRYGRLEARALLPGGQGLWCAIWMLGSDIDAVGWPACGEIDVMEGLGGEPNRVFGTVHCPGHCRDGGVSGDHVASQPLTDRHRVFAVDWRPESIAWSVDGREYHSVSAARLGSSWVFDRPFYILVNLAVGGSLGAVVGKETRFPADLRIDYVRVYEHAARR
jgi:beta-glucanase (GH16 family)